MFHSRVHIELGDLVILYMTRTEMAAITITEGGIFHNKFGRYRHEDMVGQKFGTKMHSPPPHSGYIYLLRPTPELWTLSLPHRTQILYMPDISYIIMRLGVRVGGKVIEAGTGSGSMTHSLARAVGPRGYVGSYEYHATRCEKAKEEFESHGLDNVRIQHRNVCKDGFDDVDNVEAVFLDLPAPWEAIPHAVKTLRPDTITKICCFSPCLEQVLKTVATLREQGFSDISTQEVLVRTYELLPPPLPDSSHLRSIDDIVTDLRAHEKKKEERRAMQMKTARVKARRVREERAIAADPTGAEISMELDEMLKQELARADSDEVGGGKKRKAADEAVLGEEDEAGADAAGETSRSPKKAKTGLSAAMADTAVNPGLADMPVISNVTIPDAGAGPSTATTMEERPSSGVAQSNKVPAWDSSLAEARQQPSDKSKRDMATPQAKKAPQSFRPEVTLSSQLLLRIQPEMRGHTSYLTFATFHPAAIRQEVAERVAPVLRLGPRAGSVSVTPAGKPSDPQGVPAAAPAAAEPSGAAGSTSVTDSRAQTGETADSAIELASTEIGTERTETEYGDQAMEEAIGTLTEEEMISIMS